MALRLMEGFEGTSNITDLKTTGFVNLGAVSGGGQPMLVKSINGQPGRALKVQPPYIRGDGTAPGGYWPCSASGSADPGYFDLGRKTINQWWADGGVVVGGRLQFNSGIYQGAYATGDTPQMVAIGERVYTIWYYRVGTGTIVYTVAYSDDLLTWTTIPLPAGYTGHIRTTLSAVDGNKLILGDAGGATTQGKFWFTTDDGQTWAETVVLNASVTRASAIINTGDPTWPYAAFVTGSAAVSGVYLMSGLTAGATTQRINGLAGIGTSVYYSSAKVRYPFIFAPIGGYMHFCDLRNGIANDSSWTSIAVNAGGLLINSGGMCDMDYVASTNTWVFAAGSNNQGFNYASGAGGAGANGLPVTPVSSPAGDSPNYFRVTVRGNQVISVGQGEIITISTDGGLTWANRAAPYTGQGYAASSLVPLVDTGTRFVTGTDTGSMTIIAAPSVDSIFSTCYCGEQAETEPGIYSGFGLYRATAIATNGVVSYGANHHAHIIYVAAPSGTNRTVTLSRSLTTIGTTVVPNATTQLTHYYELVLRADPLNANQFFASLRIDGTVVVPEPASSSLYTDAGTDVSSFFIFSIPRNGSFVAFDDLWVTDYTGVRNIGALGPATIIVRQPVSDDTVEMERYGGAASNAAAVRKESLSATTGTVPSVGVKALDVGLQDIYNMDTIDPGIFAGGRVAAVKVAAYAKRQGGSLPSVKIGVKSTTGLQEGADKNLSGSNLQYVSDTFEADDTGATWTVNKALTTDVSVTKTV